MCIAVHLSASLCICLREERLRQCVSHTLSCCRAQTCALMAEMGVGVNEAMLRPVSAANVYVRACANLVNQQYRQGTDSAHLPSCAWEPDAGMNILAGCKHSGC